MLHLTLRDPDEFVLATERTHVILSSLLQRHGLQVTGVCRGVRKNGDLSVQTVNIRILFRELDADGWVDSTSIRTAATERAALVPNKTP